jgi:hypothetical protein
MIVYKIKEGQIVGISRKEDTHILKVDEFGSDTWYQKPVFTGTEVIETITQQEIDERAATELAATVKADKIKLLKESYTVIWVEDTADGLKTVALILKNDGKTETILVI